MANLLLRFVLLLFFTIFFAQSTTYAQSRKRLRELEKKEHQREEEEMNAQEEGKKRHYSIQMKSTRKEMKHLEKMSKRHNANKRAPFWQRSRKRRR